MSPQTTASLPKKKEDILNLARNIVHLSDAYMDTRRKQIQERWQVYRKYTTDPSSRVIHGNIAFYIIDLYLALEASDSINILFRQKTTKTSSKEKSEYLTKNFESDSQLGNYTGIRNQSNFYKYFTGIGIRTLNHWNTFQTYPVYECVPTHNALFDPEGGGDIKNHRWFGVKRTYHGTELLNSKNFIQQEVCLLYTSPSPRD